MNKEKLIDCLRKGRLKLTKQRMALIDVFIENEHIFLTAEALCLLTKEKYEKTNLTTVYRNIEHLEKLGLVHSHSENGVLSYCLSCSDEHHHHIICKYCGKSVEIQYCPLNDLKELAKGAGYIIEDHELTIYGMCKTCHQKKA